MSDERIERVKKMKISPGLVFKGTVMGLQDKKLSREELEKHADTVRSILVYCRKMQGPRGDFEGVDTEDLINNIEKDDDVCKNIFECACYLAAGSQGGWL